MNTNDITPNSLKTQYVTPSDCHFYQEKASFLGAEIRGVRYDRVILKRALPFQSPERYICITDVEKNELGIIEDVAAFSEEQQALIRGELSLRYFCPVITDILSIKEKMGHFYFDVKVGESKKSFTVKDISKNIRSHGKNVDITDIDGNRFRITDFDAIGAKSRRKLEPYIY